MTTAQTGATATSDAIAERLRRTEGSGLRTFRGGPSPMAWSRARGARVWDADGRRYIDLDSGSAVATIGHCHPRVTAAIARQAGALTHCPSGIPTVLRADLYDALLSIAPPGLTRVLPAISGALANETAILLAKAYTGRDQVITFSGTYLGRSWATVRYAGKRAYRTPFRTGADAAFLPYPDPFRGPWPAEADAGDLVYRLLAEQLDDPASGVDLPACVVLEPAQGNGGVVFPPAPFLARVRDLCDRAGALLIFDEIQCGFGRTGRMWAGEHEGVTPDLMTIGKGIGGGVPLAAVLGREDVMTTWAPDTITATFVLNALAAAACVAAVDVILDEELVARSAALGATTLATLRASLDPLEVVGEVRGRGLFIGVDLVHPGTMKPNTALAEKISRAAKARGVIAGVSGRHANVVKICPPLVIERTDLDTALDVLVDLIGSATVIEGESR